MLRRHAQPPPRARRSPRDDPVAGACADLRPRARVEAQARARPLPSAGGGVSLVQLIARSIAFCAAEADARRPAHVRRARRTPPRIRLRWAAGDDRDPFTARLAVADPRQPRPRRRVHRGSLVLAGSDCGDSHRGTQRGRARRVAPPGRRPPACIYPRGPGDRAAATRPARSRRDISAHYDLGNDLFELMLDETMMYSCAYFPRREMTLGEASVAKLELVCDKLSLKPDDHVLEIGTGWGGFAVYAAHTRGCRVTTTTISREQYEFARARVRAEGLEGRVTVLFRGLPPPDRQLRQAGVDRDDRSRRLARLRHVLRALFGPARARRLDAAAGDRDRRPRI